MLNTLDVLLLATDEEASYREWGVMLLVRRHRPYWQLTGHTFGIAHYAGTLFEEMKEEIMGKTSAVVILHSHPLPDMRARACARAVRKEYPDVLVMFAHTMSDEEAKVVGCLQG